MANLLFELQHACAWQELEDLKPRIAEITKDFILQGGDPVDTPFSLMSRSQDPQENFRLAEATSRLISQKVTPVKKTYDFKNRKSPESKITLGYLSSDFRDHP